MRILTEADCAKLVDAVDAHVAVARGFVAVARGEALIFPPLVGRGSDPNTRFGVKAAVDLARQLPGLKIGSYWPGNRALGLPSHGSTTILLDDVTGQPFALVAATYLNALRTAAADAVAVEQLARADADTVALIGAGKQAWFDLAAIRRVRPIAAVRVFNRNTVGAEELAARVRGSGLDARVCSIEEAVRGAAIVITTTAAREPLVRAEWISPGTHVSAMGADGPGKQELDPALVAAAILFADLPAQAAAIGECQHASSAGLIDPASITAIGDVLDGRAASRTDPAAITLFDSSGIAIQDLAIAHVAVDRAEQQGVGLLVDLTG
ncbi:ornithine cyclodeaminase family protein [Sphingomonas bacterium]|uniref:ornithine cyclodeaminase family protein n=1 Tax=Sphingomonas bacterium TaxID=1895847 RepID=UPI00157601B0|nr:ornithine cyclodeaminase family protein [Sphingomonas bacterium]